MKMKNSNLTQRLNNPKNSGHIWSILSLSGLLGSVLVGAVTGIVAAKTGQVKGDTALMSLYALSLSTFGASMMPSYSRKESLKNIGITDSICAGLGLVSFAASYGLTSLSKYL